MALKTPLLAMGAAVVALSGCVNQTTGEQSRTRTGALVGAGVGALAGATRGDDSNDRRQNAIVGAALGAAGGAAIGNVLDRQAAELRNDFDSNAIDVVNTGSELVVRMPQDILFATDSASLSGGLRGDLQVLAANLNRYPNSTVEIQGHTDNTGSAAYNQDLSERRARAVTSVLASNGVSQGRLRAVGYGEDQPIASNLSPEGRAQNRRVQVVIRPTN